MRMFVHLFHLYEYIYAPILISKKYKTTLILAMFQIVHQIKFRVFKIETLGSL